MSEENIPSESSEEGSPSESKSNDVVIEPGGSHDFEDLAEDMTPEELGLESHPIQEEGGEEKTEEAAPDEKSVEEKVQDAVDEIKGGADQAKVIKALMGDKEVELAVNARFKQPVDGKVEEVELSELLSNWSGKTDLSRKYRSLEQERQKWNQERGVVDGKLQELATLVKGGNSYAALEFLCEMAGEDKESFLTRYLDDLEKHAEEYASMTPEQKELLLAKKKNEANEHKLTKTKEQQELVDKQKKVEHYFVRVLNETGVSQEEFAATYEDLKQKKIFDQYPDAKESEIIDGVVDEALYRRHANRVLGLVKEHTPELSEETEMLKVLLKTVDESYEDDAIIDILNGVSGGERKSPKKAEEETPSKEAGKKQDPEDSRKPASDSPTPEPAPSEGKKEVIVEGNYAGRELEDVLSLDD